MFVCKTRVVEASFLGVPYSWSRQKKVYEYSAAKWQTKFPDIRFKSANYELKRSVIPQGKTIELSRSSLVKFDEDVTFSVFGYEEHGKYFKVWMADTPHETKSHAWALKHCRGRVLIAGLGMGWVAWKLAQIKTVKEIVIIEKDLEIAREVFPRLEPHLKGKAQVLVRDVFDYEPRKPFDAIWFDIWPCTDDFLRDRDKLILQYHKVCDPKKMGFWDQNSVRGLRPAERIVEEDGPKETRKQRMMRELQIRI